MSPKHEVQLLVKSGEDLANALKDTLDVLADHERRIKVIERKPSVPDYSVASRVITMDKEKRQP
jgi:hypothetical protein